MRTYSYEENLLNIMTSYSSHPHRTLSELEVFAGTILGKTGAQTIRQRRLCISMRERFKEHLASTVKCMTRRQGQEQELCNDKIANTTDVGLCIACVFVSLKERGSAVEYGYGRRPKLRSFARVAAAICLKEVMVAMC
jgi:hypothetical protein